MHLLADRMSHASNRQKQPPFSPRLLNLRFKSGGGRDAARSSFESRLTALSYGGASRPTS